MADNLSREKRSMVMASIRSTDTKPELLLWENLDHRVFRRYPQVPGHPDFGNISRKIALFVDGCFWHGCPACYRAPATRPEYWARKLQRNASNDRLQGEELRKRGFIVIWFWEHDVRRDPEGAARIAMEAWSTRKGRTS